MKEHRQARFSFVTTPKPFENRSTYFLKNIRRSKNWLTGASPFAS
jgi:hypothetical protein